MKVQVSLDISHNVYIKVPIKSVSSSTVLAQTKLCNDGLMSMCMHVLLCLKRRFKCVIKGCSQELGWLALNATSEKPLHALFFMIFYLKIVFIWLDHPGYNQA
jgi:hypothetical protein